MPYIVKLIITDTFYDYTNKTEVNHFVSLIFIECLALVFQVCFQFGCMNTDMRFFSMERICINIFYLRIDDQKIVTK